MFFLSGDKLNEGDLLAEIETDKATMGFETPEEGYLAKIIVPAGTKNVPIGKLVCIIVEEQSSVAAFKDFKDDGLDVAPAAVPVPPSVPVSATPPPAAQPTPTPAPVTAAPPVSTISGERIYASPLARRLASEKGLSLQVLYINLKRLINPQQMIVKSLTYISTKLICSTNIFL